MLYFIEVQKGWKACRLIADPGLNAVKRRFPHLMNTGGMKNGDH